MNTKALYRIYRPHNFDQVIGQTFIIKTLQSSLTNHKINHAYIFSGPRGSGKTSIAKIFAKAVNCFENQNNPCNHCESCTKINQNLSPDLIEIDAASNNGVAEIKPLLETVKFLPMDSKYKIYIIDEAHMLSTAAWNAFLKTLEEPPQHIIFIFATTEFHKIPPTIFSRCQHFDFAPLSNKELTKLIDDICHQEQILISNQAKLKLSLLADGSARDCLSMLDQLSVLTNKNIHTADLNQVFGLAGMETKLNILNSVLNTDQSLVQKILEDLNKYNVNYLNLVNDLIGYIIDKITYLKTNDVDLIKNLSLANIYELNCDNVSKLQWLLKQLFQLYEKMKMFQNHKYYFQNFLIHEVYDETEIPPVTSVKKKKSSSSSLPDLNQIIKLEDVTPHKANSHSSEQLPVTNSDDTVQLQLDALHEETDNKEFNIFQSSDDLIPQLDWQEIFMQISTNRDRETFVNDSKQLEIAQKDCELKNDKISQLISKIHKVLISSKNGLIIVFKYPLDALAFNQIYWTKKGYQEISQILNSKNRFVLAIDSIYKNQYGKYYSENKHQKYQDVSKLLLKYSNKKTDQEMNDIINNILLKGE